MRFLLCMFCGALSAAAFVALAVLFVPDAWGHCLGDSGIGAHDACDPADFNMTPQVSVTVEAPVLWAQFTGADFLHRMTYYIIRLAPVFVVMVFFAGLISIVRQRA